MRKLTGICVMSILFFAVFSCSPFQTKKEDEVTTLRRQLAQTNRKLDNIQNRLSDILAVISEHEKILRNYKEKKAKPILKKTVANGRTDLYNQALAAFYRDDWDSAKIMFSQFQNRYPRHDLAVKADNWIRYIEKQQAAYTPEPAYKAGPVYKPETAYTPKEKAVTSRPKPAPEPPEKKAASPAYTGKMVEDLYNEALNAYYNQGIDESIRLFRKLSQTYPDHELAEKAKGWITYINKNRPEKTDEKTTEKRQKRQIPKTADIKDVKSHYDEALKKFYREDYDEAFSMFMAIVDERPDHSLADNALYWAGECLYGKKEYYESAMLFRDLVEKYPEGNKVPDALLKAGLSYLSLSDPENAGYYLNRVIEEYPGTSAASKAVTYLEKVDSIRPETSPYPGSDDLDMQVQAKASFKGKSRGYKNPAPRTKPWHLGTIRLRASKL